MAEFVKIQGPEGQEYEVSREAFSDLYEPNGYKVIAELQDGAYVYLNPEDDPSYSRPLPPAEETSTAATIPTVTSGAPANVPTTTMGNGDVIPVVMPDGFPAPEAD